jgi:hypothetical protein
LLNGPAGSFSKDIDELNLDRVMVTRNACARFGEENDYRNSEMVQQPKGLRIYPA